MPLIVHHEHPWDVSCAEARAIQERLAALRREAGAPRRWRAVAGADVSYDAENDTFFAAVLVLEVPGLRVIDAGAASGRARFPYVPGYLSFREGPIVLEAFARLARVPDLVIFDGHGLAHPRRFGLACHLGVLLDLPAIGCGKTLLVGEHREPAARRGSRCALRHRGETIGAALRTRDGVRPVYVSPGHRIGLDQACRVVLSCARGYRLPEPTRQAHLAINRLRRGLPPVAVL